MLPQENAGSIVLDSLSNDHLATQVNQVEHTIDGVAGSLVGQLFLATAQPRQRIKRRIFGRTHKFKLDGALGVADGKGNRMIHRRHCLALAVYAESFSLEQP